MNAHQKGFAAVGIVLMVVVVLAIGGIGYAVYQKQPSKKVSTEQAPSNTTPSPTPVKVKPEGNTYVLVAQDDDSIKAVAPEDIAKTDDQKNILAALHNDCTDIYKSYVFVNNTVFDGNRAQYYMEGSHATLYASVCTAFAKSMLDYEGGGSTEFLHKAASGTWVRDGSTQMVSPSCSLIDGKGYPKTIFETCYDAAQNLRAPL